MIQARADQKGQPAFLSFRAMDQIMQNIGGEAFSYESFKEVYDTVPGVKDIVKDFNEEGITIATQEGGDDAPAPRDDGGANVTASAKRAAKKGLGNDL
jgi:hypothetical protein